MTHTAPPPHRYARLAPATAAVAGALHAAAGRMGLALEHALAAELVDSGVARPWGVPGLGGHCFALGLQLPVALRQTGVRVDAHHALADLWFMSASPSWPSLLIQIKSGSRLGKAQRAGEAAGLISLAHALDRARMPVQPVLCAFDATSDRDAQKALGLFEGIQTWSGPSLCLSLGVDYDRVEERWHACAGDPAQNDEALVDGLYSSLVQQYGSHEAARIWAQAQAR